MPEDVSDMSWQLCAHIDALEREYDLEGEENG